MIEGWDEEETQEAREIANERSNDHIEAYLTQFMSDPNAPGHALMIAGAWGIGKSHFVRQLVERYADKDTNHHYVHVSLSGLQTIRDMDVALSVALHPVLDNGFFKAASTGVSLLARYFRVDPETRMHVFVNKFKAALYVFDDLERCEAPIQTTMGYINKFVEREGRKVVVVAHEEPMSDRWPDYRKIKEKLIGQTFTFQPVIRRPLEQFIDIVPSERAKAVLAGQFDLILRRYTQSELNNLRVLRQAVWDFARLVDLLTNEHRANGGLMTSLLDTFMPLSFDYKAARLTSADIVQAGEYASFAMFEKNADKESNWKKFQRRYPNCRVDDRIVSGDVWGDLVVHGFMDQEVLRSACNLSSYISGRSQIPSWRRLWQAFDETDEEVLHLIEDIDRRFANGEYVVPGEVLHIISLRLWLASNAITSKPLRQAVDECKDYIDDLYLQGTIASENPKGESIRKSGYGGLGIQQSDTPEFDEVYKYYLSRRKKFEQVKLPLDAAALLAEMKTNPRGFIEKVCFTNGGSHEYVDTPILAHMNVEDCANALVELRGSDQRAVFSSLHERYDFKRLDGTLALEKPWLEALREKLTEIAVFRSGFARFRIEKMVEWSIDPVLNKLVGETPDSDTEGSEEEGT